jgi:hypothetical protein
LRPSPSFSALDQPKLFRLRPRTCCQSRGRKDRPDHTVYCGGWDVGRIYQTRGGPDSLRWLWSMTVNGPAALPSRNFSGAGRRLLLAQPRAATRPCGDGCMGSGSECKNEQRPFDHVIVEPLELVPEGWLPARRPIKNRPPAICLRSSMLKLELVSLAIPTPLDPRTECEDVLDTAPNAVTAVTKSAIERTPAQLRARRRLLRPPGPLGFRIAQAARAQYAPCCNRLHSW